MYFCSFSNHNEYFSMSMFSHLVLRFSQFGGKLWSDLFNNEKVDVSKGHVLPTETKIFL